MKLDKIKTHPMKIFDEKSVASNMFSEEHKIISEEELNDIENQIKSSEGSLR